MDFNRRRAQGSQEPLSCDDIGNVDDIFLAGANWVSHKDLNTFDSDKLIEALVSVDAQGRPFLWEPGHSEDFDVFKFYLHDRPDPPTNRDAAIFFRHERFSEHGPNVLNMVRQAEAVFNLSQLMFSLYHGSGHAATFRDLNQQLSLNQHLVMDITRRGFVKLPNDNANRPNGSRFRRALHELCCDIFEAGGQEVIFSMFLNDHMKIIKQKCLDALTNILCVPVIEEYVLNRHEWFLRALIQLIREGVTSEKMQQNVVPSISVLDRLVVVILSKAMNKKYEVLMREQAMEACLTLLETGTVELQAAHMQVGDHMIDDSRSHFMKFETIAMQAISLLFNDYRSTYWDPKLLTRICRHCFRVLYNWYRKDAGGHWSRSEQNFKSMSFSSSTLLFVLTILVNGISRPALKPYIGKMFDTNNFLLKLIMRLTDNRYNDHGRCLIIINQDVLNDPMHTNDRPILYALGHLYNTMYPKEKMRYLNNENLPQVLLNPLQDLTEHVLRKCSNKKCKKSEESKKKFTLSCSKCTVMIYCSEACKKSHKSKHKKLCAWLYKRELGKCSKSTTKTRSMSKKEKKNRRFGEELEQNSNSTTGS